MTEIEQLRSDIESYRIRIIELMSKVDDLYGRPLIEHSSPDFEGNFLAWAVPVPDRQALFRTRWVTVLPTESDRYTDITDSFGTTGTRVDKNVTKINSKNLKKTRNDVVTKKGIENRTVTKNVTRTRYILGTGTTTTTTATSTTTETDTTITTTTTENFTSITTISTTPLTTETTTEVSVQTGTVINGEIYHFTGDDWIVTDTFMTTNWETTDFDTGTFTDTTTTTTENTVSTTTTSTTTTSLIPTTSFTTTTSTVTVTL